ncbi:EAL domain-containing protein [Motiliproteus sp. MSK22-1]|uniref:bifunctional diguanylate cyclase/phosphodiesterase n=1 Tax=Motiliproteus sp. MSK22-1 TaxID=1897630 RepID=UPI000978B7D1|nr:EAL domain-containing protein [Motiliproteus sp. MSK22-1]OMH33614.1 hypothetical protein BGP75_11365 [Motiliproteus sp. MSK22-1]
MREFFLTRLNLTPKFFAYLTLIGGVPLIVASMLSLDTVSETLVHKALVKEFELLASRREQVDLILKQVEFLAESLSGIEEISESVTANQTSVTTYQRLVTEEKIGRVLNSYLNIEGLISIQVVYASGSHYQVGDTLDFDSGDFKPQLFSEAQKKESYLYWPGILANTNVRSDQKYVLPAVKPLYKMNPRTLERKVVGGLIINYSPESLSNYLNNKTTSGSSGRGIFLIDQHNRFVVHPDVTKIGDFIDADLATRLADDDAQYQAGGDGDRVYITQISATQQGWKLISMVPEQKLLMGVGRVEEQLIAIFVLVLILVIWIAFHLSRSVALPIRRVTEAFKKLKKDPRQPDSQRTSRQRLEVEGSGEVADLTEGFNLFLDEFDARQRAQRGLWEAATVFDVTTEAIMITDVDGIITMVNPAFESMTGYNLSEVIGKPFSILRSDRHSAAFYDSIWRSLKETGQWEGEIYNRRKNGEVFPEWQIITAVFDDDNNVTEYIGLFSDISNQKNQEQAIWRQANYDALTELANRNLLKDSMDQEMAHASRKGLKLAMLTVDLDRFKTVNDTLGHDVGDQLLVEVARRIQMTVRKQDMVARLGGDEFTIVLNEINDEELLPSIAGKVLDVLRQPFFLNSHQINISGSMGLTVFPDDGNSFLVLLKNADIAMYKAKQAGKDCFQFYSNEMQADALYRVQMEQELRAAIKKDNFVLLYQPVVRASDGRIVGAETLIRWLDPDCGLVNPDEFIAIAEDSGLIVEIGQWVIEQAIDQLKKWQQEGYCQLTLAVNISGMQFRHPGFPLWLERVLAQAEVDCANLVFEITESVMMENSDAIKDCIAKTKAVGVGFALDDFGTGYSSLGYLREFPVDIVKIDRSFVRDCPEDKNACRLVEAIVHMAHSLDLRVTAEGVETEQQQDFLTGLGCDYLQGFYISHPLPVCRFNERIGKDRAPVLKIPV